MRAPAAALASSLRARRGFPVGSVVEPTSDQRLRGRAAEVGRRGGGGGGRGRSWGRAGKVRLVGVFVRLGDGSREGWSADGRTRPIKLPTQASVTD